MDEFFMYPGDKGYEYPTLAELDKAFDEGQCAYITGSKPPIVSQGYLREAWRMGHEWEKFRYKVSG